MVDTILNVPDVERKGWLFKWTNYIKRYQKRWFVLSKGLLSYYRNEAEVSQACRGSIKLASAVIHKDDNCNFMVSNGGTQVFHLRAKDEDEKKNWIRDLERSKLFANKIHDTEDEYYQNHYLISRGRGHLDDLMTALSLKLGEVKGSSDLIIKHGSALRDSIIELESITNPTEAFQKFKIVKEKANLFRVTTSPMLLVCDEYYKLAKELVPKFEKLLAHEQKNNKRLQKTLEQLAEQHSHLEDRVKKEVANPTRINTNTSDEDEFFEDAVPYFEMPMSSKAQRDLSVDYEPNEQNTSVKDTDDSSGSEDINSEFSELATVGVINSRKAKVPNIILKDIENNSEDNSRSVSKDCKSDSKSSTSTPNTPSETLAKDDFPFNDYMAIVPDGRRRTKIPERPNESLNLWSIMKNCIGKELTKIPMPVNFNEPLSMLQRITEDFEYSDLLDKASKIKDPCDQLVYIAAFCISSYANTSNRLGKPFNPLLGETFECDRTSDLGWKSIAEQVSHHPPMLALHCEGKNWICYSQFGLTSKFRGKYLQVNPVDISHLEFPKLGYHYTWRKVTTTVNNIIVGKLWVDNHGDMMIVNHTTGDKCHVKFIPYSYFSRDIPRKIRGNIFARNGEPKWILQGTWDSKVEAIRVFNKGDSPKGGPIWKTSTPKLIWKRNIQPPEYEKMYNMSLLAIQMNEPEEGVAPTDSRIRPDQRLMEEGNWSKANITKSLLEEKQRAARRKREEEAASNPSSVEAYSPVWFRLQKDPITGNPIHLFSHEYWSCKEKQDWSRCPDIYSLES